MELLSCKYIPTEIHILKRDGRNIEDYESKGYKVEKISNDLYAIMNPPELELIFRDEDEDHIIHMIDAVHSYTGKRTILKRDIYDFVSKIISGEISIEFQSDGSYTVKV